MIYKHDNKNEIYDQQIGSMSLTGAAPNATAARLKSDESGLTPSRREVLAVLAEVYQLLEDYGPLWYPEQLHDKLARTLNPEHLAHAR